MAPDLFSRDSGLKSDSADYDIESSHEEIDGISDKNDVRPQTTFKDKFTSSKLNLSPIRTIYMILKSFLSLYRLVPPVFLGIIPTYLL